MNQKNLISIIVLDVVVMILALGLIIFRYSSLSDTAAFPVRAVNDSPAPDFPAPSALPPVSSTEKGGAKPATEFKDDRDPANDLPRNIAFTFRHSRAKKVEIIGDFNGWVPKPLVKGKDFKWSITLSIAPGEYAYNYVIDGKPIRDPNNPKTCDIGRGFPNSLLKVKSLTDEKKQRG